jgi:phosphopantothenoylcysteine decarboxylase/phosphopantothenate--cysteine ligase
LQSAADILIGAAAVADYRPAEVAARKIKKDPGEQTRTLVLHRTPDILAEVAARRAQLGAPRVVVGFAAETESLLANAAAKLAAKQLDMIVANDVSQPGIGFGADDNRVALLFADGARRELATLPKSDVAHAVLAAAARLLGKPAASPDEAHTA